MGLNPPFGVKASLANKFIDKALTFKPKLIILIVPKETKRYATYSCYPSILFITSSHISLGNCVSSTFLHWIYRLDQKRTPYDLIWEDSEVLAGKVITYITLY